MNNSGLKKYILPAGVLYLGIAFLLRPDIFSAFFNKLWSATVPVITGVILAVMTEPAVCRTADIMARITKKDSRHMQSLAIAAVYLLIGAAAAAAVSIIIPRLFDSAALFAGSVQGYYSDFRQRWEGTAERDVLGIFPMIDKLLEMLSQRLPELFSKTFTATAEFIRAAAGFLAGMVISVYILADKQRITSFISGAARAALSEKSYRRLSRVINALRCSLVNFIGGQLSEAAVLGILCFIGMVIFGFEYPLLISTIIGVTALIPVVGAFVGTIPSVIVLFLAKPSSALWFIVFIIILQLLENNLIYPKIVGKSVGLPPVLMITAILTGAELGGAIGIILGIPLVSAAYMLIKETIEDAG